MDIYTQSLRSLPAADKLVLVERIWDDLTASTESMPISSDILAEAARRRDEMLADPACGKTHEQVWDQIDAWRNG